MPKISIPSVRSSMVGNRQLPEYSDVKTSNIIQNFKSRVHRPAVLATEYTTASPITGCSCRMAFYASYIKNQCCGLEINFLARSCVVR